MLAMWRKWVDNLLTVSGVCTLSLWVGVDEPLLPFAIREGNVFRSVSASDAIGQSQILWGYPPPQALVSSCTKHSGTPRPRICSTRTSLYRPFSPDMFPMKPKLLAGGWHSTEMPSCYFSVFILHQSPDSMIDTSILGKRTLKSVYFLNTLFSVSATPPQCKPFSRCQKKTCSLFSKYVRQ